MQMNTETLVLIEAVDRLSEHLPPACARRRSSHDHASCTSPVCHFKAVATAAMGELTTKLTWDFTCDSPDWRQGRAFTCVARDRGMCLTFVGDSEIKDRSDPRDQWLVTALVGNEARQIAAQDDRLARWAMRELLNWFRRHGTPAPVIATDIERSRWEAANEQRTSGPSIEQTEETARAEWDRINVADRFDLAL